MASPVPASEPMVSDKVIVSCVPVPLRLTRAAGSPVLLRAPPARFRVRAALAPTLIVPPKLVLLPVSVTVEAAGASKFRVAPKLPVRTVEIVWVVWAPAVSVPLPRASVPAPLELRSSPIVSVRLLRLNVPPVMLSTPESSRLPRTSASAMAPTPADRLSTPSVSVPALALVSPV